MAFDGDSTVTKRRDTLYADVIIPRHIERPFTYLVPHTVAHVIGVGSRVLVPFGRVVLEGAVVSLTHELPTGIRAVSLKEIDSLVQDGQNPSLSPKLLQLSRDIATYYVAPWGQCLRLIIAPFSTRIATRYVATPQGRLALASGRCPPDLQPMLLRIARRTTGVLDSTLDSRRRAGTLQMVEALVKNSWIARESPDHPDITDRKQSGKPVAKKNDDCARIATVSAFPNLPDSDVAWRDHILQSLHGNRLQKLVLQAPWPHRIRRLADAIESAYSLNRSSIVVTGEIARALWLKQLLSMLTGLQITLAHTARESDQLEQSHRVTPSIVVGTRSAIFSPIDSIGLIWLEGEEDTALKEPQEPRYHAREVAGLRAESERALLVLASAHPSLESKFDSTAEHYDVQLDVSLQPRVELVDLRQESGGTLFSEKLILAMQEALGRQAKILLFLNRKGYARTLVCRDCSWVPRCASCAVPFTYYRQYGRLTCRYCGASDALPDACPMCHASRVSLIGDGTERIEVETRRLFPDAKIARIDGDTLRRPASAHPLWESARSGSWDILIGTQALFFRDPLPQHGLVGILQADSELYIPDFRSAERTYQLLIDAGHLACPASAGGRVIIQTRFPTHHAIRALLSGNSDVFYEEELAARQLLHYPPLCHLAELSVIGKNGELVEEAAKQWAINLGRATPDQEPLLVLGPVHALIKRPRHYHQRILVKASDQRILSRRVHDSVQILERQYHRGQCKFVIDIDPVGTGQG